MPKTATIVSKALAAAALSTAAFLLTPTTATFAAEELPTNVEISAATDTFVTWTSATSPRDCSSKHFADLTQTPQCGRGMAFTYPQQLAEQQPRTAGELRAYLKTLQLSLAPGQQITVQFDRYIGSQDEVAAVIADKRLTAGEDARIAKEWHVVVLTGAEKLDHWVTWIAPYRPTDCSAEDFAQYATGPLCGNSLAHAYPQPLAPEQPKSPKELPAYLEKIKEHLAPGQKVTVQMDHYSGDAQAARKILADGVLRIGENSSFIDTWRVVVLQGE
ncbi:hypothetical protein [Dermatophilus congolensis]|uniref:Uncharacterized protein n=2 Tax=Dermatophilus congolensis TaxID=1863 RepID=A0A239VM15_9MICO|nr:hypothetical protein [Dermatophilus congolensis]MBO3129340.1 hypothetical protein [Dermatophilus congolensis]MBO3132027.1 hypothetical protein [Dermatophilus congolensis]MBO3133817.1 hypothetical protein [Dermatophilus congolensis]MBO3136048.1 hypothetical protein [Dermatophilus congolensis]MBO3138290.1 hypothetical protein [Dermatophilus congolensis]